MNRRNFLSNSAILTTGYLAGSRIPVFSRSLFLTENTRSEQDIFELFRNPEIRYHPFVRWWWNGDKVEANELVRELRLLKAAGIGGVEINPVEFPTRSDGDDLGKKSLQWLGPEWIEMLLVVFKEAKSLEMTCDLIVGSGWPFGAEYLEGDERSQIVVPGIKKLKGPIAYEISKYEIFREADPAISSPFPGRTMELLSLFLIPDPITTGEIVGLGLDMKEETFKLNVPEGNYALCALVKINAFMQVINGAPGATGPVLNHFDQEAVKKYLNHMSDTIQNKTGQLSGHIRAMFTDSLELEGANWTPGILEEFKTRRGYDLIPHLPFILFKTGAMGNVTDFKYGVGVPAEYGSAINRIRYDFELTKAELFRERFINTYVHWCRGLNVKSRAQAYGRGFFPLEGSFDFDIPECETWTTNYLKHKVGEEMPEDDYRRGRAYTMINKYVSSAANLKGKRLVSCEENTDTYTVFNTTLENLKIGGDQSAITGVTHSIFHGFNYSPPEAPYPGWLRYGGYYNENNTWWPWFHLYNEYKARLSALLQNVTMYTDIAVLPPLEDMWSLIGAQMEPFPSITHVQYMTLVWEAMNKNGNGCDYVSQKVIADSVVKDGFIFYGPKKYQTLFLIEVESLQPASAAKMLEFVKTGGRIFCIEAYPDKSTGWYDHESRDLEVAGYVEKMKAFPDRFIFLKKPDKDFIRWFGEVQKQYNIKPYIEIEKTDPFIMQNRYQADDGTELVYIVNSHINNAHQTRIKFSKEITARKYGWIWEAETGNRYRISLAGDNSFDLDLGPAESKLFVFDKKKTGPEWKALPAEGSLLATIMSGWSAELRHCHNGSVKTVIIDTLSDLKDVEDLRSFAGIITYRNSILVTNTNGIFLNLGKVWGLSELKVNGKECGTKWYGRRIYDISKFISQGQNVIEIKVATSMGNYMKSLTDNPIAQYWTNEKTKNQPIQSMGLIGPVTVYQKS